VARFVAVDEGEDEGEDDAIVGSGLAVDLRRARAVKGWLNPGLSRRLTRN
jgi:hypothetical protein